MKYALTSTLFLLLLFTACDPDDPTIDPPQEVITTLTYTLTPTTGGTPVVMQFRDLDGDGGNAPVITGGSINPNVDYTGSITLSNEQENPPEDITAEIQEEDLEHQFFFQSTHEELTVSYTDSDADGNPVGLTTTLRGTEIETGNLTITLIHEPVKDNPGVSTGDITNAEGEIDIEVTFELNVQ